MGRHRSRDALCEAPIMRHSSPKSESASGDAGTAGEQTEQSEPAVQADPPVLPPHVGTPQTGRLLNGAFGPSRNSIRHIAWVSATVTLRVTGMFLVGLSRHPPPSQSLILPSGQTLIHSSRHSLSQSPTSLEMQHRWQTRGCNLHCNDAVDEDEGDAPAL